MSSTLSYRGKVAALTRSRSADDPDLRIARRNLAAAKLEQYIRETVAEAPPLTVEQRDRLAELLRPVVAQGVSSGDAA